MKTTSKTHKASITELYREWKKKFYSNGRVTDEDCEEILRIERLLDTTRAKNKHEMECKYQFALEMHNQGCDFHVMGILKSIRQDTWKARKKAA